MVVVIKIKILFVSILFIDPFNTSIHGIKVASVIEIWVSLFFLCLSVTFFLILLQYNICPPYALRYKFLLGREVRAIYCCFYIICYKMITRGHILVFKVSIETHWLAQHDKIFESGTTAFLVAKILPKRFINI